MLNTMYAWMILHFSQKLSLNSNVTTVRKNGSLIKEQSSASFLLSSKISKSFTSGQEYLSKNAKLVGHGARIKFSYVKGKKLRDNWALKLKKFTIKTPNQ